MKNSSGEFFAGVADSSATPDPPVFFCTKNALMARSIARSLPSEIAPKYLGTPPSLRSTGHRFLKFWASSTRRKSTPSAWKLTAALSLSAASRNSATHSSTVSPSTARARSDMLAETESLSLRFCNRASRLSARSSCSLAFCSAVWICPALFGLRCLDILVVLFVIQNIIGFRKALRRPASQRYLGGQLLNSCGQLPALSIQLI